MTLRVFDPGFRESARARAKENAAEPNPRSGFH